MSSASKKGFDAEDAFIHFHPHLVDQHLGSWFRHDMTVTSCSLDVTKLKTLRGIWISAFRIFCLKAHLSTTIWETSCARFKQNSASSKVFSMSSTRAKVVDNSSDRFWPSCNLSESRGASDHASSTYCIVILELCRAIHCMVERGTPSLAKYFAPDRRNECYPCQDFLHSYSESYRRIERPGSTTEHWGQSMSLHHSGTSYLPTLCL